MATHSVDPLALWSQQENREHKSCLYWWKVVTRFTGSGDISEKLVSHIKRPWINMTAAKYVIKWNIFRVNKSLRKSAWLFEERKKIKTTLPFRADHCLTRWNVVKLHSNDISRRQRSSQRSALGRNFAQCWSAIINNNSNNNNFYSHNNNNECMCKAQNKSCWHRKFSVSTQIIALFMTYLHDNGHRISNVKKA